MSRIFWDAEARGVPDGTERYLSAPFFAGG